MKVKFKTFPNLLLVEKSGVCITFYYKNNEINYRYNGWGKLNENELSKILTIFKPSAEKILSIHLSQP